MVASPVGGGQRWFVGAGVEQDVAERAGGDQVIEPVTVGVRGPAGESAHRQDADTQAQQRFRESRALGGQQVGLVAVAFSQVCQQVVGGLGGVVETDHRQFVARTVASRPGADVLADLACSILAWNASPTSAALPNKGSSRPLVVARCADQAANSVNNTSNVSGMLCRVRTTVIGVSASATAASSSAVSPAHARTTRCSTTTAAAPSIACGSATAHTCNPNTRTDSACGQNAPGTLSNVIDPAGSNAPNTNACQLSDMLRTAAV